MAEKTTSINAHRKHEDTRTTHKKHKTYHHPVPYSLIGDSRLFRLGELIIQQGKQRRDRVQSPLIMEIHQRVVALLAFLVGVVGAAVAAAE